MYPFTPADLDKTPQDRITLQALIAEERVAVNEAVAESLHGTQLRVSAAAKFNCSDRLWAAHECSIGRRSASWIPFTESSRQSQSLSDCLREVEAFRSCVTLQSGFLRALGFASKGSKLSEAERWELVDKADDMYLASLLESSSSSPSSDRP